MTQHSFSTSQKDLEAKERGTGERQLKQRKKPEPHRSESLCSRPAQTAFSDSGKYQ